ncbi:MAG: transposase [Actinomycetes bacterium]
MAYHFVACERDQLMLMPVSLAEWLPEDHLAYFVIDVVAELDLGDFHRAYRADGRGGAAYDPEMMLAVLVYGYCVGERSSRKLEKRLVEDVAFRVVGANQRPDHATIARFRAQHETAIAGLFGQVLAVCGRAGLLRPGLVAVDGTKLAANASADANRTAEQLARQILKEAAATDAAEDAAEEAAGSPGSAGGADAAELLGRPEGRRGRLRRLLEELNQEAAARSYEAHVARRAEQEAATGRPIGGRPPSPDSPQFKSRRHANTTDPDSRLLKTRQGFVQGYNLQAVATEDQFVVAAEATNSNLDTDAYQPMVQAAQDNLRAAGEDEAVQTVVADAGYWRADNVATEGVDSLIAPGKQRRLAKIAEAAERQHTILDEVDAGVLDLDQAARRLGVTPAWVRRLRRRRHADQPEPLTRQMMAKLDTPQGRETYKKRAASIEPVFAQIKHNRGIRRLCRRGKNAADSEWKLICATHNLLKLYRLAV